jgi:hypothetical protein
MHYSSNLSRIFLLLWAFTAISWNSAAIAAQLQLTWVDNSTDEVGFNIERKTGTTGTYAQIASLGANVTSYTDSSLMNATTYCFRVYAFNANGNSPYSPEACGTTPSTVQTFSLSLVKTGTGAGTVSSSPAGINCGSTCSGTFTSGTVVALTAIAATGSIFAGWTGDADCTDGSLTMNAGESCTATFNLQTAPANTVSTNIANNAVLSGSSVIWTATATGSPVRVEFLIDGVLSWTEFSSPYQFNGDPSGTLNTTTLTNSSHQLKVRAVYADNSTAEQTVTVTVSNASTQQQFALSISVVKTITSSGTGNGTVTSSPAGINCGSSCSASYNSGTVVTLTATPATGSTFAGWSGTGCTTGSVTMDASKTCTATFSPQPQQTFTLSITKSGTGAGTVTSAPAGINCGNSCSASYNSGTSVILTAVPATGSTFAGWNGTGCTSGTVAMNTNTTCAAVFTSQPVSNIGLYRPSTGAWYLIANATGLWQDCNVDRCVGPFGADTDLPLAGDWNGSGTSNLAVYDPYHKDWELDLNGNATWDGCKIDKCYSFAIAPKSTDDEIPLIGSWDGAAKQAVGVFKLVSSSTGSRNKTATVSGYWYLDRNRNGKWDGCSTDLCYGPFGTSADMPVVGNWDGSGTSKIGVFTPQTGMWTLDSNGNGKFDGCTIDKCFGPFGSDGDIPVVGDWSGTGTAKIGVFRAATGEWFLDLNGNGQWDGPTVDKYITGFGQPGDLPVVGKW